MANYPDSTTGAPALYSDEMAERVLECIANGATLTKAAAACGISVSTISKWVVLDVHGFAQSYARAQKQRMMLMESQLLDISDERTPINDHGATDGGYVRDKELKINTRKWIMSKLDPRKYGDKIEISGDENNPLTVNSVTRVIIDNTVQAIAESKNKELANGD